MMSPIASLMSFYVVVFDILADVIIATFGSAQRQLPEKPTSLLPAVVEGILALIKLLDGSWENTWMWSEVENCR